MQNAITMTTVIVFCIWFDLCLLCSSLSFSKYIWTTHGQHWRPCQHQCPIVLVHEAKRMQQLVHGHNQARGEAARVQVKQLLPSLHTWIPVLGLSLVAWLTFGLRALIPCGASFVLLSIQMIFVTFRKDDWKRDKLTWTKIEEMVITKDSAPMSETV